MNLSHHMADGVCRARIDGELNIYTAAQGREALLALLPALPAATALELDLDGVTDLDSAGLQVLLAARASLATSGAALRVTGRSTAVADVLALTGVLHDA